MNYSRLSRIVFPLITFLGAVLCYIRFRTIEIRIVDPYDGMLDPAVLLELFALVIPLLILYRKSYINILFLTVQLVLVLIICTTVNNDPVLTMVLGMVFMFSIGYYLKRPANSVFALIAAAAILAFQRPIVSGDLRTPAIDLDALVMLGSLFAVLIVVNAVVSSIIDSYEALNERIGAQRKTIVALIETNVGIQKYALTKKEEFESEERLRITRDIHDTIGYVLTNNIMLLRACDYYVPKRLKKAHVFIDDALANAQSGLNETRAILKKLHNFNAESGVAEILKIVDLFRMSTGISIRIDFGNSRSSWGRSLDYTFYRIIQEGLVNAVKHGKSTQISIVFWQTDSAVILTIADNGTGGSDEEPKKGIGLLGMQERLSRFGGTLEACRYPHGFTLRATVPLASIGTEVKREDD
jgi:signal transduction histidine kinase